MAAGGTVCRYSPMDTSQENADVHFGEGSSLHERLVAYVHALENGSRRGVWGEHSYARGQGEPARLARHTRTLLAPRATSPHPAVIDVCSVPAEAPEPPVLEPREPLEPLEPEDEDPADAEDWEARVEALAPSPAHARLAAAACDALRRMRLERLVSGGGVEARGEATAAARRLRRALAPHWVRGGGGSRGAPAWLQAALTACMPRGPRRLYEEAVGALRGAAPRLAERLTGAWAAGTRSTVRAWGRPVPAEGSAPWLVWVSSGCASLDARWERRLSALVHTRVLRAPRGEGAAAPEPWCAAAAGAVRSQLTDALADAGDRSIILGGVGLGAALCVVLARGAGGAGRAAGGVRGAVLVAPPLRTPEGSRVARDDALRAVRLPLLLVVGERSPTAPHALANDVCEMRGLAAGAGARRLLSVACADEMLRVPRRLRSRLRLSQHALDAALAEECVRWALETAEGEEPAPSPPPPPAPPTPPTPPTPPPRRQPLPLAVHQIDLSDPEDDYAHLPAAAAPPAPPAPPAITTSAQSARSIEIMEGRVVSRAAGGTPLPLLPPGGSRRPSPPARPQGLRPLTPARPQGLRPSPPARLSAARPSPADIMQMPIVFADDNATDSSPTGSPVTVTSGKTRVSSGTCLPAGVTMTRVILAKRGNTPRPRLLVRRIARQGQDKPHDSL